MPIVFLILFVVGAGGAAGFYASRNKEGEVSTEFSGVVWKWQVDGGWSGLFTAFVTPPGDTSIELGNRFETFDDAKRFALGHIGGPGTGRPQRVQRPPRARMGIGATTAE